MSSSEPLRPTASVGMPTRVADVSPSLSSSPSWALALWISWVLPFSLLSLVAASPTLALQVDFEDLGLGAESVLDPASAPGGFTSGGVFFENDGAFLGFAASTTTDTTTPGFTNQYSNITGSGAGGSATFGVAFAEAAIVLPSPSIVEGARFTNTTFAALSMRDGDAFAKQFGGPSGSDPDFFRLLVEGFDATGSSTGIVSLDLADFTFEDDSQDFILDEWVLLDLTGLGVVKTLSLAWESSDVGPFGINTPTYVAIDDFTFTPIPEPGAALLLGLGLAMLGRPRPRRRHGACSAHRARGVVGSRSTAGPEGSARGVSSARRAGRGSLLGHSRAGGLGSGRALALALGLASGLAPGLALGPLGAGAAVAGPFDEPGVDPLDIQAWATEVVEVVRGPMDVAQPELGLASFGAPGNALGAATGSSFDVVSLGDGGLVTLFFESGIGDGPGNDLAVWENGFFAPGGLFAELAFVEVSSNGLDFVRFDAVSLRDTPVGGSDVIDPSDDRNLAGDQPIDLGTGFDLSELHETSLVLADLLDLNDVRYVRIVDAIGDGSTFDSEGWPIYDPYPTAFASGGFDLQAVGVLHPAPEPGSVALLASGVAGLAGLARWRRPHRSSRQSGAIRASGPSGRCLRCA